MNLTIDASVAIKFIVDEPGSLEARSLLPKNSGDLIDTGHFLSAPMHMVLEVHNTLAKKYRKSLIDFAPLENASSILKRRIHFEPLDSKLVDSARLISLSAHDRAASSSQTSEFARIPFNIYDCLYIAHAHQFETTLATADAELARIARDGFNIPVIFIDVQAVK